MANGSLIYGSTTYALAQNFSWGYTPQIVQVKTKAVSTSGTIYTKKRYEQRTYQLSFDHIGLTQLGELEKVDSYDGLVTFCPTGAGGASISGFFSLGAPVVKYTNNVVVSASFEESK